MVRGSEKMRVKGGESITNALLFSEHGAIGTQDMVDFVGFPPLVGM